MLSPMDMATPRQMPDWLQTAWDVFWVVVLGLVTVAMFWWDVYRVSFDRAFWDTYRSNWLVF